MISFKKATVLTLLGVSLSQAFILTGPNCCPSCSPCCQSSSTCDSIIGQQSCFSQSLTSCCEPPSCRCQPAPIRTTIVQSPPPCCPAPQVTIIRAPEEKRCCKNDHVTLEDEIVIKKVIPPVEPPKVLPPVVIGSTPDNYKVCMDQIDDLRKSLSLIESTQSTKLESINRMIQELVANVKTLDSRINQWGEKHQKLDVEFNKFRDYVLKLEQELRLMLSDLAAQPGDVPETPLELSTIEAAIKERGGLNIGDRWRLRFKDDNNKDFFIQDRLKKGYYRFKTTGCDQIVQAEKTCDCCE